MPVPRILSLLLCLALIGGLLPAAVHADTEIWTEPPTGWTDPEQVEYHSVSVGGKPCVLNWGVRGERAVFLSAYGLDYYGGAEAAASWAADLMEDKPGGTGEADAAGSPLYAALRSFLRGKQSHETSYNETRELYRYTDCMVSDSAHISSFYSGLKLNGAWDGGKTWNREHTWPNSKGFDGQDNDIMMLRPTSVSENSSRGNTAYGESAGYYHPNIEAGNRFDLRGDVARIMLYCYVRWDNQNYMWGQSGVIESAETLLQWMEEDPVDTWEMGRNDSVQSITGVRNCFVDCPELAWALFGREIPANGYLTPQSPDPSPFRFEDVQDESAFYFNPVYWAVENSVTVGTDATHFSPAKTVMRSDAMTFFWAASDRPAPQGTKSPFKDVGKKHWAFKAILWGVENGITGGTGPKTFSPEATCSRSEILQFLYAAMGKPEYTIFNPYSDLNPGKWYYDGAIWAYEKGLERGKNGKFKAKTPCTRGYVVTYLYRFFTGKELAQ